MEAHFTPDKGKEEARRQEHGLCSASNEHGHTGD